MSWARIGERGKAGGLSFCPSKPGRSALDQLPDDDSKQRSVFLGDLAAVAVTESNPKKACRLSELAIDQLERAWYATGMARVRAVRESLTPWEALPWARPHQRMCIAQRLQPSGDIMVIKESTSSTFVFRREAGTWLTALVWHPRFECWLPSGGHVESAENIAETAIREAREETGLDVRIAAAVKGRRAGPP